MEKRTTLSQHHLKQFSGDVVRYRHWQNRRVIYTPGVQFLAERGQAYWLLDAIVSHFVSKQMSAAIEQDHRLESMQFWRLDVRGDRSAFLSGRADSGDEPFITQEVCVTDFPLDYADIWAACDGEHWTLYLPSEH
jgi:hypothetical protein